MNRFDQKRARIFTIGHSNRKFSLFLELLDSERLKLVVDVRTIPKSRHNPQFGQKRLKQGLARHGIEYRHMAELGGLRHPQKDSSNTAWRNSSFRGYSDYMQTQEFRANLERLIRLSQRKRLVIMCAEAVPWRCHRSLISDALLARGIPVEHIMSLTAVREHRMTAFAKEEGGRVIYPGN